MPKTVGDPRGSYRWKVLRRGLIASASHCAICYGALDKSAPGRSSLSPSVDHIVPVIGGGDVFAPSNLQVVHYGCNSGKREGRRVRRRLVVLPVPVVRADWW